MSKDIFFERAVFISWYCGKGDCKFCYMSTQKKKINEPSKARRTRESVLAEVLFCRMLNWKIEFLSGGYESYSRLEILELLRQIRIVYGEKVWLNIGALSREDLQVYAPFIEGVCGAVECINPSLRLQICPSKKIEDIEEMFASATEIGIKKAMTLILGLGETISDLPTLLEFIRLHRIDRLTFYRLKPQKGTAFENATPISTDYYADWVSGVRKEFPSLHIVVGSWIGHIEELGILIARGADSVTKFPAFKQFNSQYALGLIQSVNSSGNIFVSNFTKFDESVHSAAIKYLATLDLPKGLKDKILLKFREYSIDLKN